MAEAIRATSVEVEGIDGLRYALAAAPPRGAYREAEQRRVVLLRRIAPRDHPRARRNAVLQGAAFALIVAVHAWAGCGGPIAGLGGLVVAGIFAALLLKPRYEEEELVIVGTTLVVRRASLGKVVRIEALSGRNVLHLETDEERSHSVLLASEEDAQRIADALRARVGM